jgi:transcription initiation factor TFIID subunit 13
MIPPRRSKHRHVRRSNTISRRNSAADHTSSSCTAQRSSQPQQLAPKPSARSGGPGHVPSELAPPWPFNPQETALIRAGYSPAFKPEVPAVQADSASEQIPRKRKSRLEAIHPRWRNLEHVLQGTRVR